MNNGPEDMREETEAAMGGEIPEPAMEALLRAEFRKMQESVALPAGFKERVLARAAAADLAGLADLTDSAGLAGLAGQAVRPVTTPPNKAKVLAFPRGAVWRLVAGGALAASVLAGTFGVEMERRHREASRMAHEHVVANQQFDEATRITDAALAHTRDQLQRAGVFEDQGR